jgi:predicted  nucleic acid-binding Zn-ribbon protein
MELLHVGSELGSLDCQIKRLEEKIDTSKPVEIMKDIHRLEDKLIRCRDIEMTSNKAVSAIRELDETIEALNEKQKNKYTELTSELKRIENRITDKCNELVSKINNIDNIVDNLKKKIDTTISELKPEVKESTFLRKLFWLD